MAKFSVGGEENGEGPSKFPLLKRRRTQSHGHICPTSKHEAAEEEDDESQAECEEEEEAAGNNQDNQVALAGPRSSSGAVGSLGSTTRTGAIYATLTDPEVLDCPICYEPLTIPVFQCDNRHTACSCSPCCSKLSQKCPSCSSPIGYNRCQAIEKVLESVKIPCQNMKYGCKEIVSYSKRYGHDKTCNRVPCSCPHSGCSFIGLLLIRTLWY